jgi:hypothetical protein
MGSARRQETRGNRVKGFLLKEMQQKVSGVGTLHSLQHIIQ